MLNPNIPPDQLLALALKHHQSGELAQAEALYRQILQQDPGHADALHLLGVLAYQLGRADAAVELIGQAIRKAPQAAHFHNNLGNALNLQGKTAEAIGSYRKATRLNPGFPDAHVNLGNALKDTGKLDEAAACYATAVRLRPMAEIHFNLGIILEGLGETAPAIEHYRAALRLKPDHVEALNNLGNALKDEGHIDEAIACYEAALRIRPDIPAIRYNLANALQEQGRLAEAAALYRAAVALDPANADAHFNLGNTLRDMGAIEDAEASYRAALRARPDFPEAQNNLGQVLGEQGRLAEASGFYRQIADAHPDHPLFRLRADALCPALSQSSEEISSWRNQLETALDGYPRIKLADCLSDIAASNAQPSFYMAYQGRDERPLKTRYAALFEGAPPERPLRRPGRNKPRVGYLVTDKHERAFLTFMAGIVNRLDTDAFRQSVICTSASLALLRPELDEKRVDFTVVPGDFKRAVDKVRAEGFDLIYYWEVGTDAVNYFMPFFRLAPVQCTSWGFPVTTGIPQMDYFVSSNDLEPEGGEAHYSEKLVRLDVLPTYYDRPPVASPLKPRSHFGLGEGDHIYLCPQSLYKFHPDFDGVLARILRQDPLGRLAIVADRYRAWQEMLLARLGKTAPDIVDRIVVLPRQNRLDFLNLMALADVLLDPIHFGGGNTAFEGLAVGTPIVTLPGESMRGRVTYACYRQIGMTDCVATGIEDYIEKAVRLATDRNYREQVRERILAGSGALYGNEAAVREFERFLRQATAHVNR